MASIIVAYRPWSSMGSLHVGIAFAIYKNGKKGKTGFNSWRLPKGADSAKYRAMKRKNYFKKKFPNSDIYYRTYSSGKAFPKTLK